MRRGTAAHPRPVRPRRSRPGHPLGTAAAVLALTLVAACSEGSPAASTGPSPSPAATATAPAVGSPTVAPTVTTGSTAATSSAPSASRRGPAVLADLPAKQAPAADLARFYDQHVTWHACGTAAQCTTLTVPLDYADPGRGTITIAVNRIAATGTGTPLGDLVVNPGGPGGSGLQYALAAAQVVDPAVRARYAVVGFDPRGVGQSTPVSCLDTAGLDAFVNADPLPRTAAQVAQVDAAGKAMADGCAARSARILPYLGTDQTVQDLDVLRAALGQTRLTYLGKSYGTYIGAEYAQRFPARVGRFVLDGAVDPTLDADALDLGQAAGFQGALTAFLTTWTASGTSPLGGTPAAAQAQLIRLLAPLAAHPLALPAGGSRALTLGEAVNGIIYPLYSKQTWPTLEATLTAFAKGDGTDLQLVSDADTSRGPGGYQDNSLSAFWATSCLDRGYSETDAQIRSKLPAFEKASPVFGLALAWGSIPCRYWHAPATGSPKAVHAAGAPPILVVGTTRDPATPYAWAKSLAAQLDSGVFLGRVGDGHTAYVEGNSCIDGHVDAYLLTGVTPTDGAVCLDPSTG